jgi:hypothetical protein
MSMEPRRCPWFLVLAALAGCHFESAKNASAGQMNSCNVAADCSKGSMCSDGLCVARSADMPLSIALQVTPQRSLTGGDPLPVILDRFLVQGPDTRSFPMPSTTSVVGTIRNASIAIQADVSFTPTSTIPGVSPKAVTASIVPVTTVGRYDYSVGLLSGVSYRMLVLPKDPSAPTLPPYARTFTAQLGVAQSVEFQDIANDQKSFVIGGVPSDRTLLVGAFDSKTGEPISSTAMLQGAGTITLFFTPDPPPFRLEIRAAQSFAGSGASLADPSVSCDGDTPAFPVFSVDQADLTVSDGVATRIDLPQQPPRMAYEGAVDLCPDQKATASTVGKVPVTLHSRSLVLADPSKVTASFDATTNAIFDGSKLRFCVQVMAGEYDVVVTPPPSTNCALFAEKHLIQAPDGMVASGALLQLPAATYLMGTLRTTEQAPISGAVVQAVALGRSDSIELPSDDHSVTRYNRSQQTTTDVVGAFRLPVDLGSYDVVFKPAADSGFAWQVRNGVDIGALGAKFSTGPLDMLSPVALNGSLVAARRAGTDVAADLDSAQIEAYAVIPDDPDGERAILVGKTTADKNGHFMLLLPPSTHMGW